MTVAHAVGVDPVGDLLRLAGVSIRFFLGCEVVFKELPKCIRRVVQVLHVETHAAGLVQNLSKEVREPQP